MLQQFESQTGIHDYSLLNSIYVIVHSLGGRECAQHDIWAYRTRGESPFSRSNGVQRVCHHIWWYRL